jgi:hypothetical protein
MSAAPARSYDRFTAELGLSPLTITQSRIVMHAGTPVNGAPLRGRGPPGHPRGNRLQGPLCAPRPVAPNSYLSAFTSRVSGALDLPEGTSLSDD